MKKHLLFLVLSVVLLPASVWGQADLSWTDSPIKRVLPKTSEVDISAYDLTTKKSLYIYRGTKLSCLASTMKLLTVITALSRPDADNSFRTEAWHDGVTEYDTSQGNLYVVDRFDLEFDSLVMDSLIEEVITFPFSVINGQVYGDVSMRDSSYWGHGWARDDTSEAYQPYISPLMFYKGAAEATVVPGSLQGDMASISCKPVFSYYTLTNRTRTRVPSTGKHSSPRGWLTNGNNLIITGNAPMFRKDLINVYDPGSFFMRALLERLRAKGIVVPESYGFTELPSDGVEQMAHWETLVQKVSNQLMRESNNLNAGTMSCRVASQVTGKKRVTAENGIVEIMKLVHNLRHDPKDYKAVDSCGLSSYNYLSPALLIDFLEYTYSQPDVFQKLYKPLPVAGIDGTLKDRMKNTPAFRNVHAKTGSFTAVNAPADYLKMGNGHTLVFVTMSQNVLSAARARAFQDKVCEVIIGH